MKKNPVLFTFFLFLLVPRIALSQNYEENSPLFYGTYSDNFVGRWAYQSIAHLVYDTWRSSPTAPGGVTFSPSDVKPGDILFVRNVEWFLKNMMGTIKVPFILVTAGDSGQGVRERYLPYLSNENLIEWFAIHPCAKSHPKITPIPLGLIQAKEYYRERAEFTKLFAQLRKQPRKGLLYMNFSGGEKPPFRADRGVVYELFKDKPYCHSAHPKKFENYLKEMADFKFALSPRGKDIDCYRTWEALLVGTIPIVKSSHLDPVFKDLPVLIVNEWKDVTQELLESTYQEFCAKKFTIEKLCIEYWSGIIHATRKAFLDTYKK